VLCSDWPVPLRVDHGFPPLDLKESVWPRSDTHSFLSDLILCVRFRSDGWGLREEEAHRGARVPSSPARCGTGMDDGDVADVPGSDE
jgi:hypothetical protein